jgi:hypothetical protein
MIRLHHFHFHEDICQIRLDFFSTTLQQPSSTAGATAGVCTDTILDITSGTTSNSFTTNPPNLCGTLTGQHGKYKRLSFGVNEENIIELFKT